ncbi:hypothetical protein JX265_006750 [Neoarthrinium moseri]|uniref:N-acetylgalactosaminide beta-1,3-galactosyltransferase n=1 Tax=Neoarthrinium moseri TaxID=1658444 RepID=A0A9P9WL29_9PEZI|nr:hypothetical protein JX265_006750 [Neoarthrinium moseri]
MPPSLMTRLLRKPKFAIVTVFVLIIFSILINFNSGLPTTISAWVPGLTASPFYTNDESRYYSRKTPPFFPPLKSPPPTTHKTKAAELCAGFPTHLKDSIQVVLKTGAGESAKTKAHISTVTSCINNLLIFSDLEEQVQGHRFIDVLADLPASYNDSPDFATYSAQKQAHSEGNAIGYSSDGWKLDRFKFLPMVDKAYEMRPDAEWYVFIEADVYYFWDTLFRLLHQLDPSKMHYMGSPAPGADGNFFAYGGAGFVLSRGLMQQLVGDSTRLSILYEEYVKNDCCGDAALGYAIMNKTGERLQALYPTFAGDELIGLKVDAERWCIPLLALHRVSPEQMTSLWEWERTRPYDQYPLTHSTILDFTFSSISDSPTRASWDNYSPDVQPDGSHAHTSASACAEGCLSNKRCLQYSYIAGVCKFGNFIQLGRPISNADSLSGWDMNKMVRMGYQKDPQKSSSCKHATWLKPDIRWAGPDEASTIIAGQPIVALLARTVQGMTQCHIVHGVYDRRCGISSAVGRPELVETRGSPERPTGACQGQFGARPAARMTVETNNTNPACWPVELFTWDIDLTVY